MEYLGQLRKAAQERSGNVLDNSNFSKSTSICSGMLERNLRILHLWPVIHPHPLHVHPVSEIDSESERT